MQMSDGRASNGAPRMHAKRCVRCGVTQPRHAFIRGAQAHVRRFCNTCAMSRDDLADTKHEQALAAAAIETRRALGYHIRGENRAPLGRCKTLVEAQQREGR